MKMTFNVRFSGVVASLIARDGQAQTEIRQVVRASKARVESRQKQLAPVRTGFTRKTIRGEFSDDGLSYESGLRAEDYEAAGLKFYGPFLEYGTRLMAARPFIFPPFAEEKPVFRRELNRAVRDAMRRAA